VVQIDVPKIGDDDVLVSAMTILISQIIDKSQVKISACGVCGTVRQQSLLLNQYLILKHQQDLHYHKGEFLAKVNDLTSLPV
jgi:hypothetical protein